MNRDTLQISCASAMSDLHLMASAKIADFNNTSLVFVVFRRLFSCKNTAQTAKREEPERRYMSAHNFFTSYFHRDQTLAFVRALFPKPVSRRLSLSALNFILPGLFDSRL